MAPLLLLLPSYPGAGEEDGGAKTNAVTTAMTRLVRVLGLVNGQIEAERVGERDPGIRIGGGDEQSDVFLDKPSEPSTNTHKTPRRRPRSITEFLPEDVGNSEGHVGSALHSALPSTPTVVSVSGGGDYPEAETDHRLKGLEMLFVGLAVIALFMSIPIVCHLLLRRRGGERTVSECLYSDVPAAGGGSGWVHHTGAPESHTANSALDCEAGAGAALSRYKGQAFSFRTHQSGLPAKNPLKQVRSQSGVFDRYMPAPSMRLLVVSGRRVV